jgi:hypothetical protein
LKAFSMAFFYINYGYVWPSPYILDHHPSTMWEAERQNGYMGMGYDRKHSTTR